MEEKKVGLISLECRKAVVDSSQDPKPGDLISVKIVKSDGYYLYGVNALQQGRTLSKYTFQEELLTNSQAE